MSLVPQLTSSHKCIHYSENICYTVANIELQQFRTNRIALIR